MIQSELEELRKIYFKFPTPENPIKYAIVALVAFVAMFAALKLTTKMKIWQIVLLSLVAATLISVVWNQIF